MEVAEMDKIHVPTEMHTHDAAMHRCVEEVYFGTHSFVPSVTGRHNDAPIHARAEGAHNNLLPMSHPEHRKDSNHATRDRCPEEKHPKPNTELQNGVQTCSSNIERRAGKESPGFNHADSASSQALETTAKELTVAAKVFEHTIANIYIRLGLEALGLPAPVIPLDYNGPLIPGVLPSDNAAVAWDNARQRAERIDVIEKMERFLMGHSSQFTNAGKTAEYRQMLQLVRSAKL
jgi:hypothetical protein